MNMLKNWDQSWASLLIKVNRLRIRTNLIPNPPLNLYRFQFMLYSFFLLFFFIQVQQIKKYPNTCTSTYTYITSTSPHTPQERVVYSKNPIGGHCLPLYSPKTYPKGSPLPSCHHSVNQAYIHKTQLQSLHRPILSRVVTLLPSSVL